jgi:WD40 repeat protein
MSASDLAQMSETFVSQCHMNDVNDIAVEPGTGEFFITAGSDAMVKCFNFASTKVFRALHCSAPVISVDIVTHRDSHELWGVGGCADGSCKVWNLQTGETAGTIAGHTNKVYAVRFLGTQIFSLCILFCVCNAKHITSIYINMM